MIDNEKIDKAVLRQANIIKKQNEEISNLRQELLNNIQIKKENNNENHKWLEDRYKKAIKKLTHKIHKLKAENYKFKAQLFELREKVNTEFLDKREKDLLKQKYIKLERKYDEAIEFIIGTVNRKKIPRHIVPFCEYDDIESIRLKKQDRPYRYLAAKQAIINILIENEELNITELINKLKEKANKQYGRSTLSEVCNSMKRLNLLIRIIKHRESDNRQVVYWKLNKDSEYQTILSLKSRSYNHNFDKLHKK